MTVRSTSDSDNYLGGTGILLDFKDLKKLVQEKVVERFDHQLILSDTYLKEHPDMTKQENLVVWQVEPSAENIILYVKKELEKGLPKGVELVRLVLFETSDSYAEWVK